jgi:hypothetical protein
MNSHYPPFPTTPIDLYSDPYRMFMTIRWMLQCARYPLYSRHRDYLLGMFTSSNAT